MNGEYSDQYGEAGGIMPLSFREIFDNLEGK
jgi:hypothetical protein